MGLGKATSKHLLLLLNFIFTLLGIVLIAFGIFVLVSASHNNVDHGENLAGGLIIALGVVIVVISIFGCIAAIHESRTKLIVYIISLVVLILLQLILAAMASQGTKDGLSGSVHDGFEQLWEYELKAPGTLAYYEDWLHCCGVNSTDDYHHIQHDIPRTCCKDRNCQIVDNIYKEGCQAKFEEYLSGKMLMFGVVSWILIIGEIVGAVLAWMLYSSVKNESRRNLRWM
ncbi:tetraspanin-9 [Rhagoletis pomonella]|uniref:tetraspanin-9 n=1 Tax=Rhagoletis pomonella TaxID=28610 RepID=UPI00177BFB13|nr:tetraspanin-9 [Rhagoletis pomonella]